MAVVKTVPSQALHSDLMVMADVHRQAAQLVYVKQYVKRSLYYLMSP